MRLRALNHDKVTLDTLVRARVAEATADPRPAMSMKDAFAAVRRRVGSDSGGAGDDAT